MMGKLANVSRWVWMTAVAGNEVRTLERAASTSCSVVTISICQSKNRSISADPRLVIERTCFSPGTLLTASSIGRVIVTIIWSIGVTPLSTAMSTRGKLVVGKTEIGIVKARYAPAATRIRIRKTIDLEKRVNQ